MKFKASDIVTSLVSIVLVHSILDYFGWKIGFVVCGIVALVLFLVADRLEKIAEVTRAVVERLENK